MTRDELKLRGFPISRTLCEVCQNAVPDNMSRGCEWSRSATPVPGWDAMFAPLLVSDHMSDSYRVRSCPKFVLDYPRENKKEVVLCT